MNMKLLKLISATGIAALLAGCAGGYVEGGGGAVGVDVGPDVYYGGDYGYYGGFEERGRNIHAYSDRGYHSREAAHPGFAGHAGGGGFAHGGAGGAHGGGGGHR